MPNKKPTITNTQIGAGIGAALLAAAAGAYFLYGKDAPKRRKAARSWMLRAKAEILEQIESLGDLDKQTYYDLIDAAAARYLKAKDVSSAEVAELVKELRGYWSGMKRQLSGAKPRKAAKKTVRKVMKKATKKVVKKASRKRS